jgi:hypothetical protein
MGFFDSLLGTEKPKIAPLVKKPTTLTTGVGTSTYTPKTGAIGYTLSPELQQFKDMFYGAASGMVPTEESEAFARGVTDYGQGLFNQYANLNIPQVTQDYYNSVMSGLSPQREAENAQLSDTLFKYGRTGAGVGVDGGYVNPEQFALLKAREAANADIYRTAEDRARTIQQGGLANATNALDVGNALRMQPYQNTASLFNIGTGIEGMGMNLLNPTYNFSALQKDWQTASQANQQAMNNAAVAPNFLQSLAQGVITSGVNSLTGGMGNSLFRGWSSPTTTAGTSNVSPGIRLY